MRGKLISLKGEYNLKWCYAMFSKSILTSFFILFLIFSFGSISDVQAQSTKGIIAGKLVDSETGDPLIYANVHIEGTTFGAASDLEGNYRIVSVPIGKYTLKVTYMGYTETTVTDVVVNPGDVTKINVTLKPEVLEAEEIVVTAKALRNTEAVLLKDRQKSIAVSDAISAEAISRSGSGDAAEAMTKVTGASVVDGKYVYIRGLGERYSNTHLDGAELPTADPDKKAFQMDLFPSNLLDNIVTVKTFTPDKPGNFSGGVVDIGTKTFPEDFTLSFSTSAAYNTQTTLNDEFILYPGGSTDWLGFDDGTRDIPDIYKDRSKADWPTVTSARYDDEQAAKLDQLSKAFNTTMSPEKRTAPINQSYAFSIGNQYSLFNRPLGLVAGLTYNRSASFYDNGFTGRYLYYGPNSNILEENIELEDSKGKLEVNWGALFNLGYKLSPNHQIAFNSLYTRNGESTARYQIGLWPEQYDIDDNVQFENRVLKYTERELYSLQLRGEHQLSSFLNTNIRWIASNAANSQNEPDMRFFANTVGYDNNGNLSYAATHSGFRPPSRYFRDLTEDNKNFSLDITVPFKQWQSLNSKLKIGAAYTATDRTFREDIFTLEAAKNVDTQNDLRYYGDPEDYFSEENRGLLGQDTTRWGQISNVFGMVVPTPTTKDKNNYDGELNISAGYMMFELPLLSSFKFIGGARYEKTDLLVVSQDTTAEKGKIKTDDIVPSVKFIYVLNPDINFRASYTKTLARPTFREIAPFESIEFIQDFMLLGNPNLKRTIINNIDLRWEYFVRPGEIVALSGFYKRLENPIERFAIKGTNAQLKFDNSEKATVYGIEFEIRKQLDQVLPLLKYFNSGLNLSLVKSHIDIADVELEERLAMDSTASKSRVLQGQSPYLLNIDLSYVNPEKHITLSLHYNTFGKRLANVSKGLTPDIYEMPRHTLDFTASKGLFNHLTLKFTAKNLLDAKYEEKFDFDSDFKEYIYQSYRLGRSFSLGLSYSL